MTTPTTPFDVAPDAAIEQIASFQGLVIVDLDETLYLRNSTEDFLDSAQPGLIGLLVLRALDVIKPWRFTGGVRTRDVWRVRTISWLFPWVWSRWRSRVAELAGEFTNQPLLSQLRARRAPLMVATVGFFPIVQPLLAAMGLNDVKLIATSKDWLATRRDGKLPSVEQVLGRDVLAESMVLTDSAEDLPLLERCARPLRAIWPAARFRRALSHVYLPGDYTTFIKRPGEHYLSRSVLKEDLACWVFASVALASAPLAHVLGLALLMVSFWTLYELGYMDNDDQAARFESDPKLSDGFFEEGYDVGRIQPWLWVIATGCAGLVVLRYPALPMAADVIGWFVVLIGTFAWFRLYNRYNKQTRVWMFAPLQLARGAAFLVVVPAVPVGVAIIGALVLGRWVPYYHYRSAGAWPDAHPVTTRLTFFVVLATLIALIEGADAVLNGTAISFMLYTLFWARVELKRIYSNAARIDRG